MPSLENFNGVLVACDNNVEIYNSFSKDVNINDLPNELLILIFSLVDYESIQVVEQVCSRWRALVPAPTVWSNMRLVLCMKNYLQIRDGILPRVASHLKLVKLQYFKLYLEIRVPLTTLCPNITHLEISISQVNVGIFEDLKCWPKLKFLSFRNSLIMRNSDESDNNYTFNVPFRHLKKLETLILSNFALTSTSLDDMLTCYYLRDINIEKMKNIPSRFLECLISSKLHVLRDLCIYGDTLTDDIVKLLSQCTRLCTLHITTCKSLFDSSLFHLAKLKGLKSLKLRHGYFSTSALMTFFSNNVFQRLTFLSLSRCMHVTMEVAKAIQTNAPKLQELSFYLCPFVIDKAFDRSELQKLFSISLLLD
ncbi:uncharacterized protein LOC143919285 [Arctopsyche grandis]|uniref:uncharacterized protein LOC143919285 n=1 Tax=Arctopsyche grandis TaxID=121162 RepID=UPI00406D6B4C